MRIDASNSCRRSTARGHAEVRYEEKKFVRTRRSPLKGPGRDKRSSAKCGFDSTSDHREPVATAVDPKLIIGRLVLV
jgi:hypothetical protein